MADDAKQFMKEALFEAKKSFDKQEVPVGAIVVFQGEIIARAHNEVEAGKDASLHAELTALKLAARYLDRWRLSDCTLYSTLEPCSMCMGAMYLFRLGRLVWGAPDLRHGANGSWIDLSAHKHPTHTLHIESGILEEACGKVMKDFFKMRREAN